MTERLGGRPAKKLIVSPEIKKGEEAKPFPKAKFKFPPFISPDKLDYDPETVGSPRRSSGIGPRTIHHRGWFNY